MQICDMRISVVGIIESAKQQVHAQHSTNEQLLGDADFDVLYVHSR